MFRVFRLEKWNAKIDLMALNLIIVTKIMVFARVVLYDVILELLPAGLCFNHVIVEVP
jgi:hypothetical protein